MLTETFGEILFCPESESLKEFPSPEDLKYRVIISTKPPKEYLEAKRLADKQNSQKERESDDDGWGKEPSSTDAAADEEDDDKVGWNMEVFGLEFGFI